MKKMVQKIFILALSVTLAVQPVPVKVQAADIAPVAEVTERLEAVNELPEDVVSEMPEGYSEIEETEEPIGEERVEKPAASGEEGNAADTECRLTFVAEGTSFNPTPVVFNRGDSVKIIQNIPSRFPYNFVGWEEDPDSITDPIYYPGITYTFTESKTLYAVWREPAEFTHDAKKELYDAYINVPYQHYYFKFVPDESRCYRFASKNLTAGADPKVILYDQNAISIANDDDGGDGMNFKLEYQLTAGETYYLDTFMYRDKVGSFQVELTRGYTIHFDSNGGSVPPSDLVKYHGEDITLPEDDWLTKTVQLTYDTNGAQAITEKKSIEMSFDCWSESRTPSGATADNSYQEGAVYSKDRDITLYAKYFAARLGEFPSVSREGYTLENWYLKGSGRVVTPTTTTVINITVQARWTKNETGSSEVKLTYDCVRDTDNGLVPASLQKPGMVEISSKVPLNHYFPFLGWSTCYLDKDPVWYPRDYMELTENTTLYAIWGPWEELGIVEDKKTQTVNITHGGLYDIIHFTPSVSGWYRIESVGSYDTKAELFDDAGNKLAENDDKESGNHNFGIDEELAAGDDYYIRARHYSEYQRGAFEVEVKKGYSVSYDANGGSGVPDAFLQYHGDPETLSALTPTKEFTLTLNANGGNCNRTEITRRCLFAGWNTERDESGRAYAPSQEFMENADTVLYAQYDHPLFGELPVPVREGYAFDGWYPLPNSGVRIDEAETVPMSMNLYAHWTEAGIVKQPEDVRAGVNSIAEFHVEAAGAASYQWQYSKDGGKKWSNSGAATANTDTVSIKVTQNNSANIYRCVVTHTNGLVSVTDSVRVILIPGVIITLNPRSNAVAVGENAVFTVETENAASFQWQYSKDGAHWYRSNAEGNQTDTLTVKGEQKSQGNRYRCVVTGIDGNNKKSYMAAMIVMSVAPKNCTAAVGEMASYSLKAEGIASYQWQYSKDGGQSWYKSNAEGATTDTVTFKVSASNRTMIYRCKLVTPDEATAFTRPVGFEKA